jgi:hypothetical protein
MPALYGITHSNKDFTQRESWGKNQFSSTFPASLVAYMANRQIDSVYLKLDKSHRIVHETIEAKNLLGLNPDSDNLFYAFESIYSPYEQLIKGQMPRVDLATQNRKLGGCLKGLEVKLTALPDNSTCELADNQFGTEIVVRRDTIVYLACSIALLYKDRRNILKKVLDNSVKAVSDWTEAKNVLPHIKTMIRCIDEITLENIANQTPLILQPIWKTEGKSPRLAQHCLDVFVWSDFALIELFISNTRQQQNINEVSRTTRTLVWLYKMLLDFSEDGQFNHQKISDELSYNTKNDKAFAVNGKVTHPFMHCSELTKPRIQKDEIKNIILDGGQNLLSPERRFDAIIFNSPDLFDE